MAVTGDTQLAPTKADIIGAIVQKELKFAAKLSGYFTDLSSLAVKGAKSVSYPKLSSFTVVDRASGVAGVASALTSAVDKIDLDKNAYVSWLVDSSDEVQSMIEVAIEFARRGATAHGRYFDSCLVDGLETHGVATTTAGNVTRDVVLEMRKSLQKFDADLSQTGFFISPDQEEYMLKVAEFTNAQIYGGAVIPSGVIGHVYGVPVVVHNGLGASQYFMADKSGLAYAMQLAPKMAEQSAVEFGTSAKLVAMDQLFGVKGLELGEHGVGATLSPLIIKDNN